MTKSSQTVIPKEIAARLFNAGGITVMKLFYRFFLLSLLIASSAKSEPLAITTFDHQSLSGIWTEAVGTPKGAVLIIQGSGNVAADGDVSSDLIGHGYHGMPAKLSEQIASVLAARGISSLRYSKRGVDDPNQLPNQTIPFLVKDAKAALEVVKSRTSTRVGLVGFSEGAIVATLVSDDVPVDALFLLSFPTRPIDEVFGYQFLEWPVNLVSRQLDSNHTGMISAATLLQTEAVSTLPLIGASFRTADFNKDSQISISDELIPTYQNYYQAIRGLLVTPAFANWYQSMQAIPSIAELAGKVQTQSIFLYSASGDPQVNSNWIAEDEYLFKVKPVLHVFPGVGHCFAPLDGVMGEIKTSGPMSDGLLSQLGTDAEAGLK